MFFGFQTIGAHKWRGLYFGRTSVTKIQEAQQGVRYLWEFRASFVGIAL